MTCRPPPTRSDAVSADRRSAAAWARAFASGALLLAAVGACGGAPAISSPPREAEAPPTDADPPTYTPAATDTATTGAPVGLATRGRDDEARRAVLRFLEALRDRDVPGLEATLADPIARAGGVIPRATLIAGLQRAAESNGLARGSDLSLLFDVPRAVVEPLGSRPDARRTSTRYRDDDLVVTFPVRIGQDGRRMNDFVFVRMTVGELVVRLAPEPRIVGL